MPSDEEPVAILRCGVPDRLRGDDQTDALMDLVPECQNGLPCEGGFRPFIGCARCVFHQEAEGTFDEAWDDAEVTSEFEWGFFPPPVKDGA